VTHKSEQHHITLQGRSLHFVAYGGTPANERRHEAAQPAMWYLMSEGKRHPVMPHVADQPLADLDRALRRWAKANACGPVSHSEMQARLRQATADLSRHEWWAPN